MTKYTYGYGTNNGDEYWASSFDVSKNGRMNTNIKPIRVVKSDGEFFAIGDSESAKKFNKLGYRTRRKVNLFDYESEAYYSYLKELMNGKEMLLEIFKAMESAIDVIDENVDKIKDKDTLFESEEALCDYAHGYITYKGKLLEILHVDIDNKDISVECSNGENERIPFSDLIAPASRL